jgi:hypothetical protein
MAKGGYLVLLLTLGAAVLVGIQLIDRAQAQQPNQMHMQMPSAMMMQSPMPMNQMTQQMQRQMAQMTVTVKALRTQLDRINPDLLTGQERPMYEVLKILQTHLETMHGMMGTMQGMMMQMPGMPGR